MRRDRFAATKWRGCALACCLAAFSLLPAMAMAAPKPGAAMPNNHAQAFQLGFALQTPATQTEEFLQAVKRLKDIGGDAQNASSAVAKLAKQSEALRGIEARSYGQASLMLHAMGAPPSIQTWAATSEKRLAGPLILSKESKKYARADPNTAAVMAAIDEAQAIKNSNDGQMSSITQWLKLSQGTDALWAFAVGGLAAGMHSAVAAKESLALSRSDIMRLRYSAPTGTASNILSALSSLSPKVGNLAGLVRLPATEFSAKELQGPQAAILRAYSAENLANIIDKAR